MHVILDNYAAHKHPKVRAWLDRHPRFTFHFTPTSASWLNAVEGFFAKLAKRRLKRGVFHSLVDLQAAINRFLAENNSASKALHLDRRPGPNHRRRQTWAPSVKFHPLVLLRHKLQPDAALASLVRSRDIVRRWPSRGQPPPMW